MSANANAANAAAIQKRKSNAVAKASLNALTQASKNDKLLSSFKVTSLIDKVTWNQIRFATLQGLSMLFELRNYEGTATAENVAVTNATFASTIPNGSTSKYFAKDKISEVDNPYAGKVHMRVEKGAVVPMIFLTGDIIDKPGKNLQVLHLSSSFSDNDKTFNPHIAKMYIQYIVTFACHAISQAVVHNMPGQGKYILDIERPADKKWSTTILEPTNSSTGNVSKFNALSIEERLENILTNGCDTMNQLLCIKT
jgi:hypothetical protein